MRIAVSCPVADSPRVEQVRGLFDLKPESVSRVEWEVSLPLSERPWNVGLITGPSGSGKSTVARHLWPGALQPAFAWHPDRAVVDDFPEGLGVKELTALLSSVGFSSPPAWLRPFRVLSTGQQFRVTLARLLAEAPSLPPGAPLVFDEYTSVVDRTVARVGSAAVAKAVRSRGLQFVAVTCHEDVTDWLQPDWVYRPADGWFAWRSLRRRPDLPLAVVRCKASAWALFRHHHYLSHELNPSAVCFLATAEDQPVAFSAWLPFVGRGKATRREHRTVVLPDYQGVGVGHALSGFLASMWVALGYRATSTTTHPAFIAARARSKVWRMTRAPGLAAQERRGRRSRLDRLLGHASTRLTVGFEYVGPPLDYAVAARLMSTRATGL